MRARAQHKKDNHSIQSMIATGLINPPEGFLFGEVVWKWLTVKAKHAMEKLIQKNDEVGVQQMPHVPTNLATE